jgi:phytoene dehydrogenase-like protein
MTTAPQQELAPLLQRRLEIIADQSFRERDADAHLAALREVSEEIDARYASLKKELPARLRHFMEQASYSKALDFIREQEGGGA